MTGGLALAAAAVSVGALHAVAPDHWVPLAAVARAGGWSRRQTAERTLLCGLGHVTVSVALGLAALLVGREVIGVVGRPLESATGLLLIAFGIAYAIWGLRRGAARVHGHAHAHYDHVHEPARATVVSLLVIYALDPCVAVIPILLAATALGASTAAGVVLLYEVATIGAMIGLVLAARAGVRALSWRWLDRWPDATAGAVITTAGLAMFLIGG
jgi:nickel/cobalt transporter (NicO) family protein